MKIKSTYSDSMKKFVFYADEILVFIISILAVIFSDALQGIISNKSNINSIRSISHYMSWSKVIIASFIAIIIHGSSNQSYKFNEGDKPPMIKRCYQAVIAGIGWKSLISMSSLQ